MKSLKGIFGFYVLILLLSYSFSTSAQNLKPACQVGATWNYIYFKGNIFPQKTYLQTVRCIKDTLVGNNLVSVLEVDSGPCAFIKFNYLAIDDSNGLYFKTNSSMNWGADTMLLSCRFKVGSFSHEFVHIPFWENQNIHISQLNFVSSFSEKIYSSNDSIDAFTFIFSLSRTYISKPIHIKYLNLFFGTNYNHLFGTIDFSRNFDGNYMLLNCYTDSSGTTKFIKEYENFGCDYLGLNDILETKEIVSIFPNPTADKFFISESLNSIINHIEVTNVLGEKMMESNINGTLKQQGIEVSQWQPGIYFVNLRGNQMNAKQKLVIKH